LNGWLLAIWFATSFGVVFFARDLQMVVAGLALGLLVVCARLQFIFIAIVAVFAWVANRREVDDLKGIPLTRSMTSDVNRRFALRRVLMVFLLRAVIGGVVGNVQGMAWRHFPVCTLICMR
jgi:cation/acetate symporter